MRATCRIVQTGVCYALIACAPVFAHADVQDPSVEDVSSRAEAGRNHDPQPPAFEEASTSRGRTSASFRLAGSVLPLSVPMLSSTPRSAADRLMVAPWLPLAPIAPFAPLEPASVERQRAPVLPAPFVLRDISSPHRPPDAIAIDPEASAPSDTPESHVPRIDTPDGPPALQDHSLLPPSVPNLYPTHPAADIADDFRTMQSTHAFPKSSPYRSLGEYDWKLTRRVLEEQNATPAHDADGVMICEVKFFTHDIFLPDEPFPLFLNKLHATSREDILRRRAPVEPGDTFSILLSEDVRNQLWDHEVFSTVVAVPVENHEKACVDLYVITRDLWSLRVGFKPQVSGGILEKLELSIVESNFLGLTDSLGVGFLMDQGSWEIGPIWIAKWPLGLNIDVTDHFRFVFDREFGGFDGARNELRIERPLRSSWDRDAWYLDTDIRSSHQRVFDGARIHTVDYLDEDTGERYAVDERWHELRVKAEGGYIRAWGLSYKTLVTVGAFIDLRQVRAVPRNSEIPAAVLEQFRIDRLPRAERAMGPLLRWEWYSNRYFHLTNYERFEVSESYKKGIHLLAEVRYSDPAFGADVRFVDGTLGARYVAPMGEDAFVDMATIGRIRWGANGFVDRRLEFSTRLVMPSGPLGRFVARGWARLLRDDDANERFRIGAAEGLRGERAHVAEGRNAWIANLEWRSKPVEVLSTFLGFATFVDIGSAWERYDRPRTYASVGAGLRFMAPQAMALPVAIDIAFPVGHEAWKGGLPSPVISLHFGQVFEPVSDFTLEEFYQ